MNKENIQKVIDLLKSPPEDFGFQMATFYNFNTYDYAGHRCSTVGCIAGFNEIAQGRRGVEACSTAVGLDFDMEANAARRLCMPSVEIIEDYNKVTSSQAIQVLEHLLTTGKVDWSIINEPTP